MKTIEEIFDSMEKSDIFVYFISEKSLSSTWVKDELNKAEQLLASPEEKIKQIYPLIIDPTINHQDKRIASFLRKEYNLQRVESPVLAYRKILQQISKNNYETEVFDPSYTNPFYGRDADNPALQVPLPKKTSKKDERQVFLTAEEAQKMLDAFQNEEVGPIVFVTLYYGLRKSEALGLRWQAVDFENDTISINHTVVGGSHIVEKDSTKTYCSQRTYQLLPNIKVLLLKLKDQQEDYKQRLGSGYHNNDYIFKNPNGVPYRPDSLTRSFKRALARHGLPQMRYHDLRHSTASILVDKGWDINDIKEWLGHADISTTANIYAHMSHKKKVSLAKDLDKILTFDPKA